MCEQMMFPKTWEEFEDFYGFKDHREIYTNGSRLIASFRVKQWLDNLEKHGHWIEGGTYGVRRCSVCEDYYQDVGYGWNYCPNCGAKMDEREEEDGEIHSADVVEVVRCKDCKRYTKYCFCEYWQSVGAVAQLASFDYCSYGERRE